MSKNDRRAKMEEIIALNTERHNHLQEEEDFEAHYYENILQLLDDVVLQVAAERSAEAAKETTPEKKAAVSTTMRDFFAQFEGAYQSLMEAMFPSLAHPVAAMAARSGTRSATESPGATGAAAPQGHAQQRSLSPEEEKVRAGLPAWVVVECAVPAKPGTTEFAILWTGQDPAPDLREKLELSLNGQPRDGNVFWTVERPKAGDKR